MLRGRLRLVKSIGMIRDFGGFSGECLFVGAVFASLDSRVTQACAEQRILWIRWRVIPVPCTVARLIKVVSHFVFLSCVFPFLTSVGTVRGSRRRPTGLRSWLAAIYVVKVFTDIAVL